mmetsp:Transcript_24221/g.69843  ORF Transcript_24221/g.69843 Transcript_24221/m.69843 type:complete len:90 (+) Transcript_24221:804-1073(+)
MMESSMARDLTGRRKTPSGTSKLDGSLSTPDIVHSVKPVLSGYRLALAYNLRRHETGERFKKDGPLAPPLQRLVDGMKEHFNSPQANES